MSYAIKDSQMVKTYPRGDALTRAEHSAWFRDGCEVRAVETGEFRPPRAGEWYISGAIPAAYRAPNDLSSPYHIARLITLRKVERWEVEVS